VEARFYVDPATGLPHVHGHQVSEDEVILAKTVRVAKVPELRLAKPLRARYLRVIYVPDPEPDSVFVITAHELRGKPLAAFRRRRRKKQQ
jgi:hypothetical protein